MKIAMKAALFGGTLFAAGIAHADNTYRIDGPSSVASPSNGGYAWDIPTASYGLMGPFRDAIQDNYNFSHFASVVDTKVITGDFDYLSATSLFEPDCFISPWWFDSDCTPTDAYGTNTYQAYVAAYHFWNGGDLILLNDSPYTDAIGDFLGVPTQYGSGTTYISGTEFPFDGPFGTAANPALQFSVGFLNVADVFATGGDVLATDGFGNPVVAFWEEDAYSPGSGKMIIITDVNSFSSTAATFSPLNDNGRFALNIVAGMLADTKPGGADCDKNGVLNIDDIDCFVASFLAGDL
ncbi:MAG: hypothetical protein RIB60_10135 [Phycisphaerales bacterium]